MEPCLHNTPSTRPHREGNVLPMCHADDLWITRDVQVRRWEAKAGKACRSGRRSVLALTFPPSSLLLRAHALVPVLVYITRAAAISPTP